MGSESPEKDQETREQKERRLGERLALLCAMSEPEKNGEDPALKEIEDLIREGADLGQRATGNPGLIQRTAIGWSARKGHLERVRRLARAGAPMSDPLGGSVLHLAMSGGHLEVIRELLALGVNPDVTEAGATALMLAATREERQEGFEALMKAGARTDLADEDGDTALHWAAMNGNLKAIERLWDRGQNETRNRKGLTPLRVAIEQSQGDAALWMLKHGAQAEEGQRDEQGKLWAIKIWESCSITTPGGWEELREWSGPLAWEDRTSAAEALGRKAVDGDGAAMRAMVEWIETSLGERLALSALAMAFGVGLGIYQESAGGEDLSSELEWMRDKVEALQEKQALELLGEKEENRPTTGARRAKSSKRM